MRITNRPSAARSVAAHHLDQQAVGAQRALALAGRDQEVGVVEVDRVDVVEVDERLDVDRPRLARLDRRELLVGDASPACRRGRSRGRPPPTSTSTSSSAQKRRCSIGALSFSCSWWKCRSRSRAALTSCTGTLTSPKLQRAGPERARHVSVAPGSPRARPQVVAVLGLLLRSRSISLPLGLALDQLEHRLAVGVLVGGRGRSPRAASRRACPPSRPRAWSGLRPARGEVEVVGRRRPRRGSAACAARARRRAARTATRYSRSWKVKRPIPARPAAPQRLVQQPVGVLRRRARRRSRSSRRRPGRSRRRRRTPRAR